MKEESNGIIIYKVPLKDFIEKLIMLNNDGANYIDIIVSLNEEENSLGLVVQEEYMEDYDESDEEALPKNLEDLYKLT